MKTKCNYCKSEHLEEDVTVCAHCHTPIENKFSGTEGWFYCSECEIIEPDTIEATICNDCYTVIPELS